MTSTRTVPLASGGFISVSADVDLFRLSSVDRNLIALIADALDGYEAEHQTSGVAEVVSSPDAAFETELEVIAPETPQPQPKPEPESAAPPLALNGKPYYMIRPGIMRCRECEHETSARYIADHVRGHESARRVAEKQAAGEHIHRWKLDAPSGDSVHGTCECGATREDPSDPVRIIGRGTNR